MTENVLSIIGTLILIAMFILHFMPVKNVNEINKDGYD